MTNFIPTSEIVTVKDYPYGYSLRTTLTDSIEFNKKGYRRVTQTVNPKNGRVNNPKKSTYYAFMLRYYDENNHIKSVAYDLNGKESLNKVAKLLSENPNILSEAENKSLAMNFLTMFKVDMKATVIYAGAKFEDLKPLYEDQINYLVGMLETPNEIDYSKLILDVEAIDKCRVKDFQPFRMV